MAFYFGSSHLCTLPWRHPLPRPPSQRGVGEHKSLTGISLRDQGEYSCTHPNSSICTPPKMLLRRLFPPHRGGLVIPATPALRDRQGYFAHDITQIFFIKITPGCGGYGHSPGCSISPRLRGIYDKFSMSGLPLSPAVGNRMLAITDRPYRKNPLCSARYREMRFCT